jgi:type VI protein secretion system component Hcp
MVLPRDGGRQTWTRLIREEQVVTNNQPKQSNLPEIALSEEELDKVSAGGTSKTKSSDTPKESISLNFTEIKFTYSSQ